MNLLETVLATRRIVDKRTWRSLALASIVAVAIALFDTIAIALVLPLVSLATESDYDSDITRFLAQRLGDPDPRTMLISMTLAVVALFILKDLGALAYTWWLSGFKSFKRVDLSTQMLRYVLGAPYTEVSRRSSAELLRTMNDAVTQFYGTTVFGIMTMVSNIASLIAIALALLISAPIPSIALGGLFAVAAIIYLSVVKPLLRRASTVAAEASTAAYRTAFAAIGGIKEAKLRNSTAFFLDEYRNAAMRGASAARTAGFVSAAPRYVLEILFILAIGWLLAGGLASGSSDASPGIGLMALFVAAGFRALPAITSLMGQLSNLRYGAAFVEVLQTEVQAYQSTPSRSDTPRSSEPLHVSGDISLDSVTFHYPDTGAPAVRNVSLSISRGTTVAIVGGSGAGKTTLVDLILGLHRPSSGSIAVDGVDIWDDLHAWQRRIGYVPQDVFLREATLAENVAFDQHPEDIDFARVRHAVQRAQLTDLVASLEEGLDTHIGERGSRLSGGQRQRIGIARAVYQDPFLLVLDEATSALDNETEHLISEAIRELANSLTAVIVAHRLSTVKHADLIVLMHEGRIEAMGTFQELQRSSPRFAHLVELGSLD